MGRKRGPTAKSEQEAHSLIQWLRTNPAPLEGISRHFGWSRRKTRVMLRIAREHVGPALGATILRATSKGGYLYRVFDRDHCEAGPVADSLAAALKDDISRNVTRIGVYQLGCELFDRRTRMWQACRNMLLNAEHAKQLMEDDAELLAGIPS